MTYTTGSADDKGMALTSSSTQSEAEAQYLDNLSWEGDATKAAAALEAIRYLLLIRPARLSSSGRAIDYESLGEEKKKLEAYIQIAGTTAAAARSPFVRARGRSF